MQKNPIPVNRYCYRIQGWDFITSNDTDSAT